MGEVYFNLKRKLEDLGYNGTLPVDGVPLVECIVADLLQTTRSLQHYMDLSKEALIQRDSLLMEAEPYKCDNAKLIQENNQLHCEIMKHKEEHLRLSKESKRKIKALSEEITRKDTTISKLQHDIRDISLRGLCAETLSSRNKSRRKELDVPNIPKLCMCNDKNSANDKDLTELTNKIHLLEEKNEGYCDEIIILKNQLEHRDNEILRLNMLLEGGRPLAAISKNCCNLTSNDKMHSLMKDMRELEISNDLLKKDLENSLEKQHEAMLRALKLADKNKNLQDELQKVDALALRVEEDCNRKLGTLKNEVNFLQTRIEGLNLKNAELERQLANKSNNSSREMKVYESLTAALKENDALHKEIKDLVDLNKSLQDKIVTLSESSHLNKLTKEYDKVKCPTKTELQTILEEERKKYEKHIEHIQEKMTETVSDFHKHLEKCKEKGRPASLPTHENIFLRDLHERLCESEQKILMLKKENDELKRNTLGSEINNKQNYKDIINQLNNENSELSKENILLSHQLTQYKNMNSVRVNDRGDYSNNNIQKYKDKINQLETEIQLLKKDKQEYNTRYKESFELAEKLRRDLISKQKEIEQLEQENCSYKMTNRNGKASTEQLKEECHFLKEQLRKMQTDVIKEKTLSSQIKNIQIETERSSNELHNELLNFQKKLSMSKDTVDILEHKCKELQSEIVSLRSDKSNLIDSIRKVDQERDKLVMELDNKTENVNMLEQKIKSQTYAISKLENEISELTRKLNVNKMTEHKLADNETQITFLNSEIMRLTHQLDNSVMENKRLQNSLADTNGKLKLNKIEFDKSRQEVDSLKAQLQHYVAEIRRIEELLSQKEAERSDMLEQFASLSVEANILENTNHSLESESASKTAQLQTYINKIKSLEEKLIDKESIMENQTSQIASMRCKINSLESEIKLMSEEKAILEQNITYLKQMCNNMQFETNVARGMGDAETDMKLYENRIRSLTNTKTKLESDKEQLKENLETTEKLLSNARKEIVDLKLALQDATSETKSLQESVSRLSRRESEIHEITLTKDEFELPITLEEIHEVSHEEDEDSSRYLSSHKRFSKYSHSGTL